MKFNFKIKIKTVVLSCCIAFMVSQNAKSDTFKRPDPEGCKACIDGINRNPNCKWILGPDERKPIPTGGGERGYSHITRNCQPLAWGISVTDECTCWFFLENQCDKKCNVELTKEEEQAVNDFINGPAKPVQPPENPVEQAATEPPAAETPTAEPPATETPENDPDSDLF